MQPLKGLKEDYRSEGLQWIVCIGDFTEALLPYMSGECKIGALTRHHRILWHSVKLKFPLRVIVVDMHVE